MATEDYEQELAADLWRRLPAYDPRRASLPTFVDRLVRNRVADFFAAARAERLRHERELIAFDDANDDAEREGRRESQDSGWLAAATLADEIGLRHDVGRFRANLPAALERCCAILLSGSVTEAIRIQGLHPSSYYEGLGRLRRRAREAGLHEYLSDPDKSQTSSVSNCRGRVAPDPGHGHVLHLQPGLRVNTTPYRRGIARPFSSMNGVGARPLFGRLRP